jgi:hypothetical protein
VSPLTTLQSICSATAVIVMGMASAAVGLPCYSAEPSAGGDARAQTSENASTSATMLTEAQMEALLREIGLGRDRSKEAVPPPESTASVSPTTSVLSDAEREALLRKMSLWYASRTEAAPRPRPKPSSPRHSVSRRYWQHSYDPASADWGEATRLMTDELRERGVAVDSLSR